MQTSQSLMQVARKYRRYLLLSLVLSMLLIPIANALIIERDRNRSMLYGQLFLEKGFSVYGLTDQQLNQTYSIPSDHLLTNILNVSYEYPVVTLLFYAGLAALEPGWFGPHYLANVVLVLIFHLNLILFLYVGQGYWDRRWFRLFGAAFYFFGVVMSAGFGKADPLANLFWLVSLILFRQGRHLTSGAVLGVAFQTKIYPAMILPILIAANPLSLVPFAASVGVLYMPLLFSNIHYEALIEHFIAGSSYANSITNPFYIGFGFSNPIAFIAPAALVFAFLYSILEIGQKGFLVYPRLRLRTRDWKVIYIFALPLGLIFVSWVLIWYYAWLILPVFYLTQEEDRCRYRNVAIGIFFAHVFGILANLDYFLAGPIKEFMAHFRTLL
jgi:hypothetical protein